MSAGLALICAFGGFIGSVIDSLLGELFQAKYRTNTSEIIEVSSSTKDLLIHGYRWFDNNLVNFLSNVILVSAFTLTALFMGFPL